MFNRSKPVRLRLGDVYEDCKFHPVMVTEVDYDDVAGFSLFDGSQPRSCSIDHCGVRLLTADEVRHKIENREAWLAAEAQFVAESTTGTYKEAAEKFYATITALQYSPPARPPTTRLRKP